MHRDLCGGRPSLCDAMKPTKGADLLKYLRKVQFKGKLSNRKVKFTGTFTNYELVCAKEAKREGSKTNKLISIYISNSPKQIQND